MSATPKRYHPLLVGLHWLTALLIFTALAAGFYLKGLPNDPAKFIPLGMHMSIGILILAVLVVRLIVRFSQPRPAPATAGNAFLDAIGRLTHILLYAAAALMAIAGIGTALAAGLFAIVFEKSGAALPMDFFIYPVRYAHGYIALALIALIALHVGAALYHQFIRKDNLLSRMWFGNR